MWFDKQTILDRAPNPPPPKPPRVDRRKQMREYARTRRADDAGVANAEACAKWYARNREYKLATQGRYDERMRRRKEISNP